MGGIKNKKGMMIAKEIVQLILVAGLIIAMVLMFTRCSLIIKPNPTVEAKTNFLTFTESVKKLELGEKKTVDLFMIDNSAVIFFPEGEESVNVKVDLKETPDNSDNEMDLFFERPPKCASDKKCFCLFLDPGYKRDYEVNSGILSGTEIKVGLAISDDKAECQEVAYTFVMDKCNIGTPHNIDSYECQNGFVIERKLSKEYSFGFKKYEPYFDNPHRLRISSERKENGVLLSEVNNE